MSDKVRDEAVKMSVDYVKESKSMADAIGRHFHRGPGDTVDAAMHRATTIGAPYAWLHRLRYREVRDMPTSAFFALLTAYQAVLGASEKQYEHERQLANARDSKLVRLADLVAGRTME